MTTPRIAPGGLRELGLINWAYCRAAARVAGAPDARIFSTLGRARGLFRGWLVFSAMLMPFGRISRHETELVILRVAHLRGCDYELDHHTRLAKRAGVTDELQQRVFAGPDAPGWSPRHQALLSAVDILMSTKDLDDDAWRELSAHYDERRLIEFCLLVGQYDALATTLGTLRVQRDFS